MRHEPFLVLLFCAVVVPPGTARAQVNQNVDYFEIDGDHGSSIAQYVTSA